ncbi:alpha/beta hydrolase [Bacillus sp. 31A1R]|uniref:Alpha/beta hydrolase n=1 Tax=Robertmurraya mangrovi TaxID=3098077 RepID=A0ABU5IY14_9BACI|nr:alpha/beta hydrolase [Bacillus sp. 31A1R]MDZ5472063.1 alpha/beta hydrolase [Bacillus sp. 31A1R]
MKQTLITGTKLINGNDLYYEYYKHSSQKETLLLIHGFLSSTFSFRRLIPFLKEEYNVISVDFPPFGKSGKSTKFIYSYDNIAKSIVQLIQVLNINKITVIGHSMGGQISLKISHLRPDIVENAVLLCSSGYLKRSKLPLVFSSYIPYFHLYVKFWLSRSGVKQNLKNVVHDHSLIDDEMLYGYTLPFLENDIFKGLTRMIRHREEELSENELGEIKTPCLLIWGEHDRVVPLSVGKRLNQDLKNSDLIVLKDTGHLVPEERPNDVFNHIHTFLKRKVPSYQ